MDQCPNGHDCTADNTIVSPGRRGRRCRKCRQESSARAYARRRGLLPEPPPGVDDRWCDQVVVDRVLSDGPDVPGRRLTRAEWIEVFRQNKGRATDSELAERAGITVGALRDRRYKLREAVDG